MLVLWSAFVSALILSTTTYGNLYEDHVDHGIRYLNEIRSWHDAPPVKRHPDPKFDHDVQKYAEKLAARGVMKHSGGMSIDAEEWMDNLFAIGTHTINKTFVTLKAIGAWYGEIRKYTFGAPHFVGSVGHFSCSMWRSVKYNSYGVGTNEKTRKTYVVGAYSLCNFPWTDSMRDNVRPPMNELACRKAAKLICVVPNYSACREPYNDMVRCIIPQN